MSYGFAFSEPKNYFHDRIVFIGTQPKTTLPDNEPDKFRTPYTRWTYEASGGVEILLTSFINLVNGDWLRTARRWRLNCPCSSSPASCSAAACAGFAPGSPVRSGGGSFFRSRGASAGILAGQLSNYWFPWLVIAGGQVPCALACALVLPQMFAPKPVDDEAVPGGKPPATPGYTLIHPPFGEGSYGKVWLARSTASGEWRAIKIVYQASFGENTDPVQSRVRWREPLPADLRHASADCCAFIL